MATVEQAHDVASVRPSKRALLKTHKSYLKKLNNAGNVLSRQVKQPLMSEAYPASTKSIREVEIIPLSELQVGHHHRGKGIIVKTISAPYHGAGIVAIVEDEFGNADKLTIHNHTDTSILANVPEGCVLAVKEPFYKHNGDPTQKDFIICVDHPSDVILLRFNDPIIPPSLRLGPDQPIFKLHSEWRNVADKAFLERDFPTAIFCYTEALDLLQDDDTGAREAVFAKRAGTSLLLGCFDGAKSDALASRTGGAADWKAYFTAARAAYGLWSWVEGKELFEKALELNPDAAAVKKDYARCLRRLEEERTGNHDFKALYKTLTPQHVHMDGASYFGNTEVRVSATHGRGIFAVRDIKAGELVFCEKAGQMPNQYEPARASAALYAKMTHQLFDNPSLAPKVLALHGGDYERSGLEGTIVDGVPVVDVYLLESIRTKNCFSSPLSTVEETKPNTPEGRLAKGLWPYASYMNHGCVANTHRSFMGDLLMSRATRPIAAGEELFQNYISIKALREARQKAFAEWGFQCACALCAGEERSPEAQNAKRRDVRLQLEKLAAKYPPGRHAPDAVMRNMERLGRQLEELHEEEIFARLPRMMLIFPSLWLLAANRVRKRHAKAVEHARSLLRNFGFLYALDEQGDIREIWDRCDSPALMSIHVVTALRDASESLETLGESEKAKQFMEASRYGYKMVTGFEDDISQLETMPMGAENGNGNGNGNVETTEA